MDCIVIGGGLSGLSAATRLETLGARVAVVEAADRLGGRTLSKELGGATFDLGGQWVGPTQDAVLGLIRDLGLETHHQFCDGRKMLDLRGRISTYNSDIPSLGVASIIDLAIAQWRVNRIRRTVPPDTPHTAPNAEELDRMTCDEAIRSLAFTQGLRDLLTALVRAVWGVEPADLSYLQFLAYINSADGLDNLINIKNGFQEKTILGGSQQLTLRQAETLKGRIMLSSPVLRVVQDEARDLVVVHTADGKRLEAKYVICAMPPASASRILFEPRLPPQREQLMQRNFIGSIIKVLVLYETAFWRENGWSGEVLGDARPEEGPVFQTFDDSLPGQPALVCFINGDPARQSACDSPEGRRAKVIAQLVRWFGVQAANPLGVYEKNWVADPWTRGCPVGNFSPGALFSHGTALRRPCGRVHWAGTEAACKSQGFLDGAIRSGRRAATEVSARLNGTSLDEEPSWQRPLTDSKECKQRSILFWGGLLLAAGVVVVYSKDKLKR